MDPFLKIIIWTVYLFVLRRRYPCLYHTFLSKPERRSCSTGDCQHLSHLFPSFHVHHLAPTPNIQAGANVTTLKQLDQILSKGRVRGNKLQVRLFPGSVDGPSPQNAAAQKGLATAPSLHQTTWNALLQTKGITQDAHLVERLERGWRPFYLHLIYKPLLKARFPVNNQTLFDPKGLHE